MALSNAYDDILAVRHNGIYPDLTARAGRSHLFRQLPSVGRGHCNFEDAQIGAGLAALVQWVEGRPRP